MFFSEVRQKYGTLQRALVTGVLYSLYTCMVASAQPTMHRITFVDKGPGVFLPGEPSYEAALADFAPRALERRRLHGKQPLLDTADQPLYAPYLVQLQALVIHAMAPIRLRNCVLALIDSSVVATLRQLPMVLRVQPTREVAYVKSTETMDCEPRRYGESRTMHNIINTMPLHNAGIFGSGVVVGMIDIGFRESEHSSLAHLNVLGRLDVVEDQPEELDGHGTISLSIIAGNAQDTLVGIAPHASYLLARAEDQRFERRQEEDNLCSAIEWVERSGADVASMSIGYRFFDEDEEPSFSYANIDGNTTFASQAVNRAVSVGLVCVTAAGNLGPAKQTLIAPADADSVVTVGAVNSEREVWSPSSRGPTADGRLKPDIVALGHDVLAAGLGVERYILPDGTSSATPQIAGSFALLKQLVPSATTYVLREAMYSTAQFPEGGDTATGHGIPDITAAARRLGPCFGAPSVVIEAGRWILVLPIFSESSTTVDYTIRTRNGTFIAGIGVQRDRDWWSCALDSLFDIDDTIEVRVVARDSMRQRTRSFPSDTTWYTVTPRIAIACGVVFPATITSVANENVSRSNTAQFLSINRGLAIATTSGALITLPYTDVRSIQIVDLLGFTQRSAANTSTEPNTTTATSVTLPQLQSGWYMLVVQAGRTTQTIPLIITD